MIKYTDPKGLYDIFLGFMKKITDSLDANYFLNAGERKMEYLAKFTEGYEESAKNLRIGDQAFNSIVWLCKSAQNGDFATADSQRPWTEAEREVQSHAKEKNAPIFSTREEAATAVEVAEKVVEARKKKIEELKEAEQKAKIELEKEEERLRKAEEAKMRPLNEKRSQLQKIRDQISTTTRGTNDQI